MRVNPELQSACSNSSAKVSKLIRPIPFLLIACLIVGTLWAADDPFIGKWKVNQSKSTLIDEMKVESAGPNKWKFTFGPGEVDTVIADGTDQPALNGTTLAVTVKGPNNWEVIRKFKGRMLLKAEWTLSADGKTLKDDFTQYLPDGFTLLSQPMPNGSSIYMPLVYDRTAGTSGLLGTWDSDSAKASKSIELQIQQGESGGLSLRRSDEDAPKKFMLDGKDYPEIDASGKETGATYSARRINDRNFEVTYKSKTEITGTLRVELSADLKTLTVTDHPAGQVRPKSTLVFDRE